MALATVFNPTTKKRKQVTVGDPNAFAGGWILETPTNNLKTYKPPEVTNLPAKLDEPDNRNPNDVTPSEPKMTNLPVRLDEPDNRNPNDVTPSEPKMTNYSGTAATNALSAIKNTAAPIAEHKEGETRTNPSGVVEVYTPEGTWRDVNAEPPADIPEPSVNKDLYIGETNWGKLKETYTDAQLAYATELIDGKRYWNPNVRMKDYQDPGSSDTGDMSGATGSSNTGDMSGANGNITGVDIANLTNFSMPSAADILADVINSAEFKWYSDRHGLKDTSLEAQAQSAQSMLDSKYEADKTNLENKLAANGLAFSGIRGSQVAALTSSLAASKLAIDRKLATQILDLDSNLMDTVLSMVSDRVKEASDGRKEALGFLEDMGLTINPFTGELTPTLAAQKESFDQEMAVANFNRQTEASMTSPIYKEWQNYKAEGGTLNFDDYMTADANRKRSVSVTNIVTPGQQQDIEATLNASRGKDITDFNPKGKPGLGYVDTAVYKSVRNGVKDKTSFDKNYAWMLNPNDPTAKGLAIEIPELSAWEVDAGINQMLATEWADLTDEEKALLIRQNGRNPSTFGILGY